MGKYGYDVLVIPNNKLDDFKETLRKENYKEEDSVYSDRCFENHIVWMPREQAEKDSSYKQPIPYVTIIADNKVALFQRFKGGEDRLAGKYTIGIGGHVERCDALFDGHIKKIIFTAFQREVAEEIIIDKSFHQKMIYLCFNEEMPYIELYKQEENNTGGVNNVHIGLSYSIKLKKPVEIKPKGDELKFVGWYTIEELLEEDIKSKLEDWSIFVAKEML